VKHAAVLAELSNAQAGCPANDKLCGFKEGMQVMIFDDTGASDIFSITNVQDEAFISTRARTFPSLSGELHSSRRLRQRPTG
jgi:hypothetical protein